MLHIENIYIFYCDYCKLALSTNIKTTVPEGWGITFGTNCGTSDAPYKQHLCPVCYKMHKQSRENLCYS